MDGKDIPLDWFSTVNSFEIPFFQRQYVWNDLDFNSLIESINGATDNVMPFFGSIILKSKGKENHEYIVIDGQQRITTFSIMIRAILDLGVEKYIKESSDLFHTLRKCIYTIESTESGDDRFSIKLIPSRFDKDAYDKLMDPGAKERPIPLDSLGNSKIENAYRFFCDYFSNNPKDIKKYATKFHNNNTCSCFIRITLNYSDDEQNIFDSVNSTGRPLSNSDIIKNYLFQKLRDCSRKNSTENVLKIYDKYWDSLFNSNEKNDFWYKQSAGKQKIDNLESFLRDYAVIKQFYSAKETTGIYGLCKTYKEHIDEHSKKLVETLEDGTEKITEPWDRLCDFIKDLYEYAVTFYKYRSKYLEQSCTEWNDGINRLFLIMDSFETTTFNPFILKVLKESTSDEMRLNRLFNLEKFFLFRFTFGATNKNYNQCCEGLIKATDENIYFNEYMKTSPPSSISYKTAFRKLKDKQGRLLLYLIELHSRSGKESKYSTALLDLSKYTLEHVMPQKWVRNADWRMLKSFDEDGNEVKANDIMWEENRNKAVKSLGNFALLTGPLNAGISNSYISKKIDGDGKTDGMRKFAISLNTTTKIIDVHDSGKKWNEKTIYEFEADYYNTFDKVYGFSDSIRNYGFLKQEKIDDNFTEFVTSDAIDTPVKLDTVTSSSPHYYDDTITAEQKDVLNNPDAYYEDKHEIVKAVLRRQGVPYDESFTYAKYHNTNKYFWADANIDYVNNKWTVVLVNNNPWQFIVCHVPAKTFSLAQGKGNCLRTRVKKNKNKKTGRVTETTVISLKILNSFVEKQSKQDFSKYVTDIVNLK